MQPDPQETRLQSPEHVTGNRGRLGAASAPRRQRTAFPQDGKEALPGALWGGGRAARGPFSAPCCGHQGRPSPGRGHTFVNRDYRGPWGRLGRLDMSARVRVVRTSGRVGNVEKV